MTPIDHHDQARREGRLKAYRFSPEVVVSWMKDGRIPEHILVSDRIPEDAALVGWSSDYGVGTIAIILSSMSFPRGGGPCFAPYAEDPRWGLVEQ